MRALELLAALRRNNLRIFSLQDIVNLFPDAHLATLKNNLVTWVDKGYIERLKRDLYACAAPFWGSELPDLYVANKLYTPSYISLETALSLYSIIPEIAVQATSVTTRPSREFKNRFGLFIYRTCKKRAFTGYRMVAYEGYKVLIADREKALVDFLYVKRSYGRAVDFADERFDDAVLKELDWTKAEEYARLFDHVTSKTVHACRTWVAC
jgi:predicted transcriptional regulator of viral defense system